MTLQRKKEIGISIFLVLYSIIFFFGFTVMVEREVAFNSPGSIVVAIAGLFWVAFMSSGLAFITTRAGTNYLLALLPALVVLLAGFSVASIVGAIMVVLMLFAAQKRLQMEIQTRVKANVTPIFYGATKLIAWAGLLALISLAFPQVSKDFSDDQIAIPEKYIASAVKPIEPLVANFLPGYQPGSTVDGLVDAQLASQQAELPPGAVFPPDAHSTLLREFSKSIGQDLTGRETMATIVTNVINNFLRNLTQQSNIVFSLLLIGISLLAVRAIIPFLVWPAMLLIMGIIKLSTQTGLIGIVKTQITVDRMTL